MRSIVCVKRVPDTEARIRITVGGEGVDSAGVKYILNPYDEFALEAGLKHKELAGEGEVSLLSVGTPEVTETLRTGLAMGADSALLLEAEAGLEGIAVATAIAAELRDREFDIVLFGMKAIDDDLQAMGSMVAELLGLPVVTVVREFTVKDGVVTAHREIEGGVELVELKLPCVLTITKGAYEPRYASLKGIMAAKKKPLEERKAKIEADATMRIRELSYPPERKPGRIVGEGPDAVPELVRLLREETQVL